MTGFVNILKESGMTSSDVVVKVRGILRRATGQKCKVGHLGTLDPMATGVLPIAIGNATRLFDISLDKTKTYVAEFQFGLMTDTIDSTGIIQSQDHKIPNISEIEAVLPRLIGKIDQIPPLYSAKSIDGKRAYKYAREGKIVELEPKQIEIFDIKLIDIDNNSDNDCADKFSFVIVCSSGTYIRSIARDMGELLGTKAIMSSLKRTESGPFYIENAVALTDFEQDPLNNILDIDIMLNRMSFVNIDTEINQNVAYCLINGIKMSRGEARLQDIFVTCDDKRVSVATMANGEMFLIKFNNQNFALAKFDNDRLLPTIRL